MGGADPGRAVAVLVMGARWDHDPRPARPSHPRRTVERLAVDVADAIVAASETALVSSLAALDAEDLRTLLDRLSAAPGATRRR